MPYIGNTSINYADRMTKDELASLHSHDLSGKFQRAIENMWYQHCYQNAYELVSALKETAQFAEEIADLNTTEPDWEQACSENDVCIVDGTQGAFFFSWNDLSTIEVTAHDDAMIDFVRFAKDNGLDLTQWRFDPETDEVVPADSPRGQALSDQSNALDGFISHKSADGNDVDDFLHTVALEAGLRELATALVSSRASDTQKRYEPYINQNFFSQQSNDDVKDAARNACDEYNIDADDYRREVYEHYAVDRDLAQSLRNQGETVVELAGFEIWGRTCTGQSVVLDHSIQQVFIHEYSHLMDDFVEEHMPEVAQRIRAEVTAEIEQKKQQENAPAAPAI